MSEQRILDEPVYAEVAFDRSRGQWGALIRRDGVERHLGYFDTRDDADTALESARHAA